MGEMRQTEFVKQNLRNRLESQSVNGRSIIKIMQNKFFWFCINLPQDKDCLESFMKTAMNLQVPQTVWKSFTTWRIHSFSQKRKV
jgi:hypothetical protein